MYPMRMKRPFWRVLLAFPALISLLSAITLLPGVVSAAPKVSRPALPAVDEALAHYAPVAGSSDLHSTNQQVIKNPKVFLIFEDTNAYWEQTNSEAPISNMQMVQRYFTDVSGSTFEGILGQYSGISNTFTSIQSVVDTTFIHQDGCGSSTILDDGSYPTTPDPTADIGYELQHINAPMDYNTIYFVFTPPGYQVFDLSDGCKQSTCGYHRSMAGAAYIYAVIPSGGGRCKALTPFPDPDDVQIDINTASHEQFEAISDPGGGGGWSGNKGEMGDECQDSSQPGFNAHTGAYLNGHLYADVQGEYNNATSDCVYTVASPSVVDVPGGGTFHTVWEATGGPTGALGAPTDSWYPVTGGQAQDFEHGGIYWSSATGTYEVQGTIHSEYITAQGGPTGVLGFPTTDEQGIANGRVSYFYANLCGARGPNNSGSAIYYSSATGAHQVGGCIYNHYWNLGGPAGNGYYAPGFPTSDVLAILGGYVSYFYGVGGARCGGVASGPDNSGSAIYSSGVGTYEEQGCTYAKYQQMGATGSALGFPVSDENQIKNSSNSIIGWVAYFYGVGGARCDGVASGPDNSGGAIYVAAGNVSASSGHEVKGCVYAKYQQLGGPTGRLGFPVSDENILYDSSGNTIGWASYFQGHQCGTTNPYGSGSAVYVAAGNVSASSGREVQGCVFTTYQRLGGPNGLLGFPVSDENTFYDSSGNLIGWGSYFAGTSCGTSGTSGSGVFVSASNNNASGGHEVHGCIYHEYMAVGGPAGMGFPTSDEVPIHNSAGTVIGSVSYFSAHLCNSAGQSGSGSAIYHSGPETHEVQGCIYYKYWHDLGGPWGCLGFPTSDEYTNSAGDRESDFQHGSILWNSTGATSTCS